MVREGRQPRHSGRPSGHSAGHVRTTDAEYSGEKYLGLVQRVRPASASCGEQRPHQPTLGGLGGVEQQQCLVRCRVGSLYPCASGRPQDALMRSANWRPVSLYIRPTDKTTHLTRTHAHAHTHTHKHTHTRAQTHTWTCAEGNPETPCAVQPGRGEAAAVGIGQKRGTGGAWGL